MLRCPSISSVLIIVMISEEFAGSSSLKYFCPQKRLFLCRSVAIEMLCDE
jgi:hypothetical protein